MKSWTALLVFLVGCTLGPHIQSKEAQPEPAIEVIELFSNDPEKMKTPKEIPSEKIPDVSVYSINTRIVIETQPISFSSSNEQENFLWWARDFSQIKKDLENAELIYRDVGLSFVITEIVFKGFEPNIFKHWSNNSQQTGMLTIVYMLPNAFTFDGLSSAPWDAINRGIIIRYGADEWTIAHEIGHYFGLVHPFEASGDFVEDTPPQKSKFCVGKMKTPNCGNIMIYCYHSTKKVTPGQIDRMRRFIRAERIDHYILPEKNLLEMLTLNH